MVLVLAGLAWAAPAQALDRVVFGTNWVAEAEHGGFYQARRRRHLREIRTRCDHRAGWPECRTAATLLLAGKLDFFMSANLAAVIRRRANRHSDRSGRGEFQKDPQVFDGASGQGRKFEDLKTRTLFIGEGRHDTPYFQWLKSDSASTTKASPTLSTPRPSSPTRIRRCRVM